METGHRTLPRLGEAQWEQVRGLQTIPHISRQNAGMTLRSSRPSSGGNGAIDARPLDRRGLSVPFLSCALSDGDELSGGCG